MLNIFEDEMFLSLPLENNGNRAKEVSFISCATKNKRGKVKEACKKFYFQIFHLFLQTNYWAGQKNSLSFFLDYQNTSNFFRWQNSGRAKLVEDVLF